MKLRVLQFTNSFHLGGSERQAVQLTKLLHEEESCEVFLACLNDEGVLRKEVEALGFKEIPEFKISSFYNARFLKQLRSFAKYLREKKIDIIQTHDFYTNVFGILGARLAGVSFKIAAKRETNGMRSKAQIFIENQIFKIADKIIVNSKAVKDFLIRDAAAEEKIEVIYNGLDLKRLVPKTTDRKEICRKLNLPADEKIRFITLVANLRHTVKNQPMFLRAAQKVLQKHQAAHFVLAGEGELKSDLEKLTAGLKIEKNTHFIGRCDALAELLSISEICVLTSFAEGFSNSILEYMAAARPVAATDVGGAKEAIIKGETGFLVGSDDDEALAKKLIFLIENQERAAEMGRRGREIVETNFSTEAQLRNTLTLYGKFSAK